MEAVWMFFWLRLARYKLYLFGLLQFNIKIISYNLQIQIIRALPMNQDNDGEYAHVRRRRMKNDNQQDEDEQTVFKSNPKKAINKHFKQKTQKDIQKQIQYFGNAIEPFHMLGEQDLGEMNEDGFFVFNRKNKVNDAWLSSIGEADEAEVTEQIVKKIKEGGRFQSVYQAGQKINKDIGENNQEEQEKDSYQGGGIEQAPESQQSEPDQGLTVQQLIQIMIELIPRNSNANNFMKKLKKDKNNDEYNKLLTISNQYIEKTGQYDILTKKRQQLQEMLDQIVEKKREKLKLDQYQQHKEKQDEEQVLDWDDDEQNQQDLEKEKEVQKKSNDKKAVSQNQSDSQNPSSDQDGDNIY